ncbi:hypothetical protein BAUCODRAFT_150486 [Baudoinia panamericana UAMH 10762]|uniref:DNA2/NAM7 helicase-like C-terminal domain-containing protein n=1 Tax=Baudoinia panamericana (strain UAMH 10762) TaxID=717646 RepID=M2N2A7_BAUPA|nr:uncharacterized protein BAUCODRAFT_150486 [Baudoinia panamericana UAMH 10762]EMC93114.1 hypothetical protein BAUCODRAFT_150486 [Baudoinia panamericana UAMH 10762]
MEADDREEKWRTPLSRSVPRILRSPNFNFAFCNQEAAVANDNRQFFVNVQGVPVQEENGTSCWNPSGAKAVVLFTRILYNVAGVPLTDIGIISTYSEDVRKITLQLKARRLYSGRKKKVILLLLVANSDITLVR